MTTPRLIPAENVRQTISDPTVRSSLNRLIGIQRQVSRMSPAVGEMMEDAIQRLQAAWAKEAPKKLRSVK